MEECYKTYNCKLGRECPYCSGDFADYGLSCDCEEANIIDDVPIPKCENFLGDYSTYIGLIGEDEPYCVPGSMESVLEELLKNGYIIFFDSDDCKVCVFKNGVSNIWEEIL